MVYQIKDYVSEDKKTAIQKLGAALAEQQDIFSDFMREKFNNDYVGVLTAICVKENDAAADKFYSMYQSYCRDVANDILSEEGMYGCFLT